MGRQVFSVAKLELASVYDKLGSAVAVASHYGVSKQTILRKLKRHGITPHTLRKVTPKVEKRILSLAKAGLSVPEAADKLNLDASTVRLYAKKIGAEFSNNYHVGFVTTWNGYRKLYRPEHPRADAKGYVMEHVLVAEAAIGRMLGPSEVVHHKDGSKTNNAPSNLEVMTDSGHRSHHARTGDTGWTKYHGRRKI